MDVSWTIKKAERQRIDAFEPVVLEKTFESPLDCKGIKPVNPKGKQHRIFLGRKAITNLDRVLKSRYHFADKGPYNQSYGFSSSHVQM